MSDEMALKFETTQSDQWEMEDFAIRLRVDGWEEVVETLLTRSDLIAMLRELDTINE